MAQVKYVKHVALRDKLKRMASSHPVIGNSYSALATLILDMALVNNGFLPKEAYYGSNFQQPGMTYTEWILQLKRAGILAQFKDEDQPSEKSDWIRFKPGPVAAIYVNDELARREQLASMRDIVDLDARKVDRAEFEETKRKLEETNKTVAQIAEAVRKLQEAMEPPDSPEKEQVRRESTLKIASLARIN